MNFVISLVQDLSGDRQLEALPLILLALILGAHAWFSLVGWENRNLPGVEFRQAQTAISAHFIQRENNFSLAYPTPVLGKPWSIPMEFPLYQWSTVAVSNLMDIPLTQSARGVSLACFYLSLPAMGLFLLRVGLSRAQMALALAAVLTCPLYIFYSRAFLIETMALMFSVWFAFGFIETMARHSWRWWAIASGAGAAAGAVKVTTLILFLIPCAAWGLYLLVRAVRTRNSSKVLLTLGWGLGCVLLPGLATLAWTRFADAVKSEHTQAAVLTSESMTQFNFGYGLFDVRFAPETWDAIVSITQTGILSFPTAVVAGLLITIRGGRWRGAATVSAALFLAGPIIFPLLYAWHDYYFVANALFLMLCLGFLLAALWEQRAGRIVAPVALLALGCSQAFTYFHGYYPTQALKGANGTRDAFTLQELTQPDDVIVIIGDDWNSMIPYYAKRRALMIRRTYENDYPLILQAIRELKGENVALFVLMHDQIENEALLEVAEAELGVSRFHYFDGEFARIYPSSKLLLDLLPSDILSARDQSPLDHAYFSTSKLFADRTLDRSVLNESTAKIFTSFTPKPDRFYFQFGPGMVEHGRHSVLNAHTTTRLWFDLAPGQYRLSILGGLFEGAWARSEYVSDGVSLTVTRSREETETELFYTYLNPRDVVSDRGEQSWDIHFELPEASTVEIEVGPGPSGSGSTDWFYFREITFE